MRWVLFGPQDRVCQLLLSWNVSVVLAHRGALGEQNAKDAQKPGPGSLPSRGLQSTCISER